MANVTFDTALINKYNGSGPRYTSYPTAVQFTPEFTSQTYQWEAFDTNTDFIPRPLSLYLHVPFCDTVCFYCGCNKIATKDRSRAETYVEYLAKEIDLQSRLFEIDRPVTQLHFGGGTPTFLSEKQMRRIMSVIEGHFQLLDDDKGEYSIELDPRDMREDTLAVLRDLGINRASIGVQDFNPVVQKAVNRIQPYGQTAAVVENARELGFKSINIDLIYGLPFQSTDTFSETLDQIIELNPDRLSVFNYAHLPHRFKPQRRINADDLPSADEKLAILSLAINKLNDAGYQYIGMDHFAKPDDELFIAQQNGTLMRNFQGYATGADADIVAMGVSAISKVGRSYSQNTTDIEAYYNSLDKNQLPIVRGILLTDDDVLRRAIIEEIICHFRLNFDKVSKQWNINFKDYFPAELTALQEMDADGLIELDEDGLKVTDRGRILVRHVCMVFDKYLHTTDQKFSKII